MENSVISSIISLVVALFSGLVMYLCEIWKVRVRDPIRSFVLLTGRIQSALVFYSNKYTTLVDLRSVDEENRKIYYEASRKLRALASELVSTTSVLPKHRQKLPNNDRILDASRQLIGLSNNIPCVKSDGVNMCRENREYEEEIRKLLGLQNKK
jgi:hypothetical protein